MTDNKSFMEATRGLYRLLDSLAKWPTPIKGLMPGYKTPSGTVCHKCVTRDEFLGDDCHPLADDEVYCCTRCATRYQSPRS